MGKAKMKVIREKAKFKAISQKVENQRAKALSAAKGSYVTAAAAAKKKMKTDLGAAGNAEKFAKSAVVADQAKLRNARKMVLKGTAAAGKRAVTAAVKSAKGSYAKAAAAAQKRMKSAVSWASAGVHNANAAVKEKQEKFKVSSQKVAKQTVKAVKYAKGSY